MANLFNADVIVVGAGPIGAYLGWKLAASGLDVHLFDALPLETIGDHIEVIHIDKVRFDEFEIPHPEPPEFIHLSSFNKIWSVDRSDYFEMHYPFYVLNMPAYMQRLHRYIREAGGKVTGEAPVGGIIFEEGYVKGVTGEIGGEPFEARAKIVIDASGMKSAVRTRLPDDFGVENVPVPVHQTFYSALELREDLPPGYPTGSNSFLGSSGFWNMSYGDGVILGMVIPQSAEAAWEEHRRWREERYGDPGKLVAKRVGCAPYRRAPQSYVGNGFVAVGDSVYQNKAFSGEGIVSGYTACKIAHQVIVKALEKGDYSKKGLWAYNRDYFRGQGAKFAGVMAFLFEVNFFPAEDVDFLYQNKIIFSTADYEHLNMHYELDMPRERWNEVCKVIEKGVADGKFNQANFERMKVLYELAEEMKEHYLAYPDTPDEIEAWGEKQKSLWGY